MSRLILCFILFLGTILKADQLTGNFQPQRTCGTPQISSFNLEKELEKLKEENPAEYRSLLAEIERVNLFNSRMIQQKLFWAFNFTTNQYYSVPATLRKTGTYTKIWVEDASWNTYVNDTVLNELLANLENYSGSTSIDPSKGIIEIDTMLFGQPPNYDGDEITDFFILDIKDSFDPAANNYSFIAGYFSPTDQTNGSTSNKMDLMYLDAYPAIFFQNSYRIDPVLSTTAHEFQHLIHHHYDKNEELWVNEGLSELAGTYCGYGLNFPDLYLQETNQNLIHWGGEVKDYSRVDLWTLYCAEQLGLSFIKSLTQNATHGTTGFNESIINSGNTGNLNTIFSNWILANLVNDTNVDPRFGYYLNEARDLKAKIGKLIVTYPQNIQGVVEQLAVEYHQFRGKDSLEIIFLSSLPENFWTASKNSNYAINELTESYYSSPHFTEDSTYVLLLFSLSSDLLYSYNTFAKYSLRYYELSYDDNQTDLAVNFPSVPAIAANRFVVPEPDLELEKVSFWSGSKDYTATLRILDNRNNNSPGTDLITPLIVSVNNENSWIDVELPAPIPGLDKDQVVYGAVEFNDASKRMGYDNQSNPGVSYLHLSGVWHLLSDFVFSGNQPANGVWMIRAVFSGLALSDTTPLPQPTAELIVYGAYPNIFSAYASGTNIIYNLQDPGEIRLLVYNSLGQKVSQKSEEPSGSIYWDGYGNSGPLAAGIYFYQLVYQSSVSNKILKSKFNKIFIFN
ncbi:MAG: hypothetical protein A2Y94_05075 [Caldithrix sp. RBG_13_44_9]|nr:MAG: hypothetical protein A2Y94_05075 [Caldithrix sp. RBG_13_44_9]